MAETNAGASREAALLARLEALESRLAELEARAGGAPGRMSGGPMEAFDAVLAAVLPAEALGHMRAARREQLLAMRSVLDRWIERTERTPPERRRRESIPVQET